MDFFTGMEIAASGMAAERTRIDVASSNLANVNTTKGANGQPYQRRDVILSAQQAPEGVSGAQAGGGPQKVMGVKVDSIATDGSPPRREYDPGHPDADADGYVSYPNVNTVEEMVDMITASRAYQAGATALDTSVQLAERALSIGK